MESGVARLVRDKGKGPNAGKARISDAVPLANVERTAKEKPASARHQTAFSGETRELVDHG